MINLLENLFLDFFETEVTQLIKIYNNISAFF